MFDGLDRLPLPPAPIPPRPSALDTRAIMPMVRALEAEVAVEILASAVGANAVAVARWLALNWGDGADIRDPAHPAHVAALEPASPTWKLAEARDALATACWRLRISTGRVDGLVSARHAIECAYGADVAECALKPLVDAAAECPELNALIAGDTPEPLPSEPPATSSERQAGAQAIAAWLFSVPDMSELKTALARLQEAAQADAGSAKSNRAIEATGAARDALGAVRESISEALARGIEPEEIQAMLDWWTEATGAPQIRINVERG
ncbi:MAG: hypothetical protein ACREFP_23685 [Acetobacteraceae bacterium]